MFKVAQLQRSNVFTSEGLTNLYSGVIRSENLHIWSPLCTIKIRSLLCDQQLDKSLTTAPVIIFRRKSRVLRLRTDVRSKVEAYLNVHLKHLGQSLQFDL